MAGVRKGGAQHFTVQEAQNIALGQAGSMFNDGTAAMKPPTDHVFVAITALTDLTFDASGGLIAADADNFVNTETAAHNESGGSETALQGSGGIEMDNSNIIPKGVTIYGRWIEIDPAGGECIAYIGK
tara:strand:- start:3560 stop:3943 length:384 start_codon:yes stop_codon:yes gene_type:complete